MTIKLNLMRSGIFVAAGAFILSLAGSPLLARISSETLTLSQCYEMAVQQSEILKTNEEKIQQFEQKISQSFGAVLPNVHFLYTELWQDTSGSGAGGSFGNTALGDQPQANIQVRQPLFSGRREFNALAGIKSEKQRQVLLLKRAHVLIYQDIANIFYMVIQLEKDLENTQNVLKLSQQRVEDIEGRVRLGKSRSSELRSAKSQLFSLRGEAEVLKGQIQSAKETLRFLIGQDVGERILKDDVSPNLSASLAQVLEKAQKRNDLLALEQDLETKGKALKVVRGALSPTANLLGNYYLRRSGIQQPISWDVFLTVDLPIFQGGADAAAIRIAASDIRQARLALLNSRRSVETAVRKNYINLQAVFAQLGAFENAFKEAEESYRLLVGEYQHGLVNNLEVLQALNTLVATRKTLDQTIVQTKLNFLALQIAIEDVPQ